MTHVTLVGNNLGERHRYLNSAVNDAFKRKQDLTSIEDITEQSPVDRIFKINLALKLRNVDYIIKNLKDDDLLYVSKALKCKWLLEPEFQHILNPEYLEDCLYPSMITTAVTKMKHWVFLNLKDPESCQRFFVYYCDINFKLAVKFLRNCSADFIREIFSKHMHKISPHDFKILCEKVPLVAKMFFDAVVTDEEHKKKYLSKEKQYFTTLKSLLKRDTEMVLDITEKYFNRRIIDPFNSKATKFILKHYRNRFSLKPELYTALLLNMNSLASCLNSKDAIDLTLTLARDSYLKSEKWFDYKRVEPIIKRIKPEDRVAIKKRVFVDNDVGAIIEKWTYEKPSPPVRVKKINPIFQDQYHNPDQYKEQDLNLFCALRATNKCERRAEFEGYNSGKTMLDKLFDEYRVTSFDTVLFELRKKLKAESSPQNRQNMMLVLVSKAGGRENNIAFLMELLSGHKNEPSQIRAAIVRSLVKRAQVWRVVDVTWNKFLEFSHMLGLDGNPAEVQCIEGIHAVVIRHLLNGTCDSEIMCLYLKNFSTLEQYSFSISEKEAISGLLPRFLFNEACESIEVRRTETLINKLLDILIAFRLSIENYPGLVSKIESLARTNILLFSDILRRLYRSRIARRELFQVNFVIIENEDSYLNALRHDVDVISIEKLVKLIKKHTTYTNPERYLALTALRVTRHINKKTQRPKIKNFKPQVYQTFLRKISIYFNEKNGLAKQVLNVFKSEGHEKLLAKPLSLLLGDELMLYVKNVDSSIVDIKDKIFAAAMRANAHLARPALNIDIFGWSTIGKKAIANKVLVCRNKEVRNNVQKLLKNKQTMKLACLLAQRDGTYLHCFSILSRTKPTLALKLGFKILMNQKDTEDLNIWNIVQPMIENFDVNKDLKLPVASSMPIQIRPTYCIILFKAYSKKSIFESMSLLCHIENILPIVNEEFIENVIVEFLSDGINVTSVKNLSRKQFEFKFNCLYIRIIIKYLLLCKTEESQKKRYEQIGVVLFDKIALWLHSDDYEKDCHGYLQEVLRAFRYYEVFLSDEYVSCIPVMTRALEWMKKNISVEKKFKEYVQMHMNMMYYNAIRESIDMLPNRTIDDSNQIDRNIVGYIFGKHIAREISNLKTTYFDSVQYLNEETILSLRAHFINHCEILTLSLVNGILDHSENNVLAIYLYKAQRTRNRLETKSREEILQKLRKCKDIEMQMVLSAETLFYI